MIYNVKFYAEEDKAFSINFSTNELYTAILSRNNHPFVSFIYDKISKTARMITDNVEFSTSKKMSKLFKLKDSKQSFRLDDFVRSAVFFGNSHISFSDIEIEAFKSNNFVKYQFEVFVAERKKNKLMPVSFGAYVNMFPFKLIEPE